jgi:hypothetical protein
VGKNDRFRHKLGSVTIQHESLPWVIMRLVQRDDYLKGLEKRRSWTPQF